MQIGERELHRWLVGFPERRRTPWDAAWRHCVREEEELTRQKPRDPQNESSSSSTREEEEEEKHGTKNPSQQVSDRRQQPRPPVRPPVTGYSRSPWHKYRLGKCDRRPRAPPPTSRATTRIWSPKTYSGPHVLSFFLSFFLFGTSVIPGKFRNILPHTVSYLIHWYYYPQIILPFLLVLKTNFLTWKFYLFIYLFIWLLLWAFFSP